MPATLSHPPPLLALAFTLACIAYFLYFLDAAFSHFLPSFNPVYHFPLQRLKIGMGWDGNGGMNEMSVSIITCLMDGDYLYDLEEGRRSDLSNVCYINASVQS